MIIIKSLREIERVCGSGEERDERRKTRERNHEHTSKPKTKCRDKSSTNLKAASDRLARSGDVAALVRAVALR